MKDTVSIETAQRLLEAGIVIENPTYYWRINPYNDKQCWIVLRSEYEQCENRIVNGVSFFIPDPTTNELFIILPDKIEVKTYHADGLDFPEYKLIITKEEVAYKRDIWDDNKDIFCKFPIKATIQDALAEMAIYLKKEGYM